jgi:hypothetical protein
MSPGSSNIPYVFSTIREGTSISFKKNGISLGEAFSNIPEAEELHPFVALFFDKNQQITSVDEPSNTSTTI